MPADSMEESSQSPEGFWFCEAQRLSPRKIGQAMKKQALTTTTTLFVILIFISVFFAGHWINVSDITGNSIMKELFKPKNLKTPQINCSSTCPANQSVITTHKPDASSSSAEECPEYFRWIHEDLRPWRDGGITREMVEKAKDRAYIRIVILNGRVYLKKYKWVFQSRDVFTLWGILQLLRLYPGRVPDLDLMFECGDMTNIRKWDYKDPTPNPPPPLFHYCGSDDTFDIVFPDWSFWGWPEIGIKPWKDLKKELKQGNSRIRWIDRQPQAYWKGNPYLGAARPGLVKCNVSRNQDWNARIYSVDWEKEHKTGYKTSNLANQCIHRYKIYAEGNAWSVSEKYILACNSMSLFIKPHYYDFFTRGLLPTIHYWPIDLNNMCRSIKFAVDWGNSNVKEAQKIGKAASDFIQEKLKMKYVYDYMFHLLYRYAKLLKYQPTVPEGAVEVCLETLACSGEGLHKAYKMSSMVEGPADTAPCTMPPQYDPSALQAFVGRKENLTKQVETWEAGGNVGEAKLSPPN